MGKKVEKITVDMNEARLPQDLERYQAKALEMGATRAAIIRTADIRVDERVTLKCQIPRCFGYGAGAHCPPNTMKPAELQELLKKYHWAVLFILDVPPTVIVRDKATIKERVAAYQQVYKIVNEMESMAFYDGHYLAFGFAAGSCRHTFCGQMENCQAMEGKRCRFSLRSRPSMEAVGMDVYKMVAAPSAAMRCPRTCPKAPWPGLSSCSERNYRADRGISSLTRS
jgi:predicted metal-binding protein